MQVTETLNEGLKRGYTITLAAAELEKKVTEKLVEAQPDVELKGFRKGKVPLPLLRKQFGQRIMGDAMQEAIDAANAKGITVSTDLNYRKNLWKWGKTPAEVMPELVAGCDVVLGNEEDADQ